MDLPGRPVRLCRLFTEQDTPQSGEWVDIQSVLCLPSMYHAGRAGLDVVLLPAGPQRIPQAQQGSPWVWYHQYPYLSPLSDWGLPEDRVQV